MLLPFNPQSVSLLSFSEQRELLARARHAIVEAVVHNRVPDLPVASGDALSQRRGVFVSLYRRSRLRGCVGQTKSSHPLNETVAQCAIGAALGDPRFAPVKPEEVDGLAIEISVLSEPHSIQMRRNSDLKLGNKGCW
jgi:AmmeMemoRadiSam system protein A